MPVLVRKKKIDVVYGIKCDKCGMVDDQNFNDFAIRHTFGYGSPCDMSAVELALCDACLLGIVLESVPNAKFIDSDGVETTKEEMAKCLEDHKKHQKTEK